MFLLAEKLVDFSVVMLILVVLNAIATLVQVFLEKLDYSGFNRNKWIFRSNNSTGKM